MSSGPHLLSQNGRLLWEFCQKPEAPSYFFRCVDLLTERSVDYTLVGFRSPIGVPLAMYWLEEDLLVLLDLNDGQGGLGRFVSQRKVQLDHASREASWLGPLHRQHPTGIEKVLNIVLGEQAVVLIGHDPNWQWNVPSQLVLPLSPHDLERPAEELALAGMSPMADATGCVQNFFFIGHTGANPSFEPKGLDQKLYFVGQRPCGVKSLFACPCVPLGPSFHSQLLSLQVVPRFPPAQFHSRHLVQKGTRLAAALFCSPLPGGQCAWSLGCLDTKEARWIGPLAEWTAPEGERAEAEVSRDGGLLALLRWDLNGQRKVHSFPLPFRSGRIPSLTDSILLAIQCSLQMELRGQYQQLLTQLGHYAFC